jgi:hypothetical protein
VPHFYFHILDGHSPADDTGLGLADLDHAETEALRLAGAVVKEEQPKEIWHGQKWELRVTDSPYLEGGRVLLTVCLTGSRGPR